MRRAAILLALALAGAARAAPADPAVEAQAAMLRKTWQAQKLPTMTIVQNVYSRVVGFALPRPFVIGSRAQSNNTYIVEYIPDGETVDHWTRMITVTGNLGVGAIHRRETPGVRVGDAELAAAIFTPKSCPVPVYRDLGAAPPQRVVTGRAIVIGCGPLNERGSERGAIVVYRDDANVWTVQYAERNNGAAPFDVGDAAAKIAQLNVVIACRADDTTPACRNRPLR